MYLVPLLKLRINKDRVKALVLNIGIIFLQTTPVAAEQNNIEYKIKAGYLYNFTKFISWPQLQSETFNLCIIGINPFGSMLDPIEKKSVMGKPIRLVRQPEYPIHLHCHIAFIKPEKSKFSQESTLSILSLHKTGRTTLLVSDQEDFSRTGSSIGFMLVEDKVKLQIDLFKLRTSGLSVSAKLLEIANIVGEAR